jgi:hypothetical protein
MKKIFFVLLLIGSSFDLFAYSKYWIQFSDKNGTPYTTTNPSAFLSNRSIQRRQNQGIPVTWYDLPVNPAYVSQVLATGAVTLNFSSRWLNAISITTTDANALTAIAALPFVVSTTPVQRHRRDAFSEETNTTDDARYTNENDYTPQAFNYGSAYNQVHQINVDCIHNMGYSGQGIEIAVLDDGFNSVNVIPAFDSIRLNNQILGTYDFVLNTPNVYSVGGHGTMCLSCMAANLPGQTIGTAPHASYWLLRTEDAATEYIVEEDYWVAGAEYADSVGADIISTSLYYTQFDDASQNHTYADMNGRTSVCAIAATMTARVGMLTFACAGNSGQTSWFYVGTPADADSVYAVGAVDNTGAIAGFSSRGPSYDGRIKPDICARGVNATVVNSSGTVTTASGTSFATPLSAGGAASLWSSQPTVTAMQLYFSIRMSADQFNSPDNNRGYGIPDFCQSGTMLSAEAGGEKTDVGIYPNPSNGMINISFRENQGDLFIYDVTGNIVAEKKIVSGEQQLDFTSLSDGIYFCRIFSNGNSSDAQKIVIAK